ncbi:MAG: ammonia-forming cytochrome c nitrite reductase subunit c552 [Thermoflexales bacterium]|nr:ammonia-forming cytochrome c nitrite reductase subunit c552 [Thermoflexales bacterium]
MKSALLPPSIVVASLILLGVTIVHAQGTAPPRAEYAGSQACAACHPAEYKNWSNSLHARMIQSPASLAPTTTAILADLAQLEKIIPDSKARYAAEDIVYTIGWRYRQRYILQDSRSKRLVVAAGEWNIAGQGPAESDNTWREAPAADWLNECAGCHTSGLDLGAASSYKGGQLPFAEAGVGCEACHGAGSDHVKAPTRDNIPVNKLEALDAAICGQCHTRGVSPEVNGRVYDYPVGYVPGDKLTEKNFIPLKPGGVITDSFWWQDGHAKGYRQQYPEWESSAHATSLESLQNAGAADACLGCHSADYAVAVSNKAGQEATLPTLKTAQFGVTCQACHAPHKDNTHLFNSLLRDERYRLCTACHNATGGGQRPLTPNTSVHHAVQEMFEGQAVLEVDGPASPHMPRGSQGADCTACHMPATAGNADPGDTATHNWDIIRPGQGPDACSACHANLKASVTQFSTTTLSLMMDLRQNEIQGQLRALNKSLKETKSMHPEWNPQAANKTDQQLAYERAVTYVSFVETDGSSGAHNYEYAKAVLARAEKELIQEAKATATPTATSTPTPTPTPPPPTPFPTPTPIPAPSGGASWSIWALLGGMMGLVVLLLVIRRPER